MTTHDATVAAQVQQGVLSANITGDNVVISGVVGKLTKVFQILFVVSASTNITFKSGSVAIGGPFNMLANGSFVLDYIQLPITCLNLGDNFVINQSGAATIGGIIWYAQI